MARPTLLPDPGPVLDRIYDSLPEHYRLADEKQGYALYRYLAGPASQYGLVDALIERFDADPTDPTRPARAALADPAAADPAWLPWLAQLVGVVLDPALSLAEQRDAIRYASAGWRAGTKASVADAARTALTGTRFARVYDHSITEPGDGGQWDVLIVTRATETPDVMAVLDAVVRRGAKPVGVTLHHRAYSASWGTVETTYPTWGDIKAAGSFARIQEAGL